MRKEARRSKNCCWKPNMFIGLPLVTVCITSLVFVQSFGQPCESKSTGCTSVSLRLDLKDQRSRNPLQERGDGASTSASLPLSCINLINYAKINPVNMQTSVRALTALYSYLYASATGSVSLILDFAFIECPRFTVSSCERRLFEHRETCCVQELTGDVASGPRNPAQKFCRSGTDSFCLQ